MSEMPMAERVARALWERDRLAGGRPPWDQMSEEWREAAMAMGRTAIEAMREPTEAMLNAGPLEPYMDRGVWAEMIDEALK